jgi:hypothetical protein
MVEACAHNSSTAAAPGVVLCVADGIVRVVGHVVASEDLGCRVRSPRAHLNDRVVIAAGPLSEAEAESFQHLLIDVGRCTTGIPL